MVLAFADIDDRKGSFGRELEAFCEIFQIS
jgi:hypothetical protein